MALDPQVAALVAELADTRPLQDFPVHVVRRGVLERELALPRRATPSVTAMELALDTACGNIPARLYRPRQTGSLPLLVFFHGGGFVMMNLDTHDELCRHLCAGAGCAVLSVDYRLAPEHRFPAGADDALAATRWAAQHAGDFGCDPGRIAVGGDSAGGNLAAVAALRVRDEGGPRLCGQLLIYPVTDHHSQETPSYAENANGYGLSRDDMIWFWGHYLADAAAASNPHASPLRSENFRDLPPALVVTAEYDPLRDEGEAYAERLRAHGVDVVCTRYNGMNHGFARKIGQVDRALAAVEQSTTWLAAMFARCDVGEK